MDAQAKQQIVERVKQANNVLVTVSNNPSVDQLAACIGLTLLLNRMDKHGTAVFSGAVPSTIEFLQPEKTIETNTDSLRDFIISLDKNKADKLRYKVEDQVVRIFITPYKTSLSEKDLVFSQGDINVDVVIALGVHDRNQIDAAITAHGRILHDATVISLNAGQGKAPELGQINWQDPAASSLSEMLVSISEAFGPGLIDNQIATAFLTGIVAETQRFSNPKTTPKTMTMAAQLMAAGANQQLIVSKLEPPSPPTGSSGPRMPAPPKPSSPKKPQDKGTLNVSHDKNKPDSGEVEIAPGEIHIDDRGNLKTTEELKAELERLKKMRGEMTMMPEPTPAPLPAEPAPAPPPPPTPAPPPAEPIPPAPPIPSDGGMTTPIVVSPEPKPHELLDPMDHRPTFNAPFTADTQSEWIDPYSTVTIDPLSGNTGGPPGGDGFAGNERVVQPPPEPPKTLLTPAALASTPATPIVPPSAVDNARSAVENAIAGGAYDPAFPTPVAALNAQPMGPELHQDNSNIPTPSLPLPTNGTAPQSADPAPPAPPAVPPPLPMNSAAVAALPPAAGQSLF